MNSKLFFIIGLITVSAVYGADSDYSFKNDLDRCVDKSDSLCDGSSDNGGDCELYQGLVNISTKVQVNLTVTQRTTFTTFIESCKTEVFSKTDMTNEEKFIEFSSKLSKFSKDNADIYGIIQYQNISTWSSLFTVEKVTIIKQQTNIQYTIELDSSNKCPLFDGLLEAAQEAESSPEGCSSCAADLQNLIDTELIQISKDSTLTFEEKTIQIQTKITTFYSTRTSFESKLKFKKIKGFGSFYQYMECGKTYKQVPQTESLCTGTFPDIPIINYLQIQLNIYKSQDVKVALQFNQFIQRVNQSFTQTTDVQIREKWFADYVQQWMVLNYNFCTKYIFTVGFGEFGSCYDFCFCEGFEGPVIVTKPTTIGTTPMMTSTVIPSDSTETSMVSEVTDEMTDVTDGFSSISTSLFTEIPSTSSSCGCVCE